MQNLSHAIGLILFSDLFLSCCDVSAAKRAIFVSCLDSMNADDTDRDDKSLSMLYILPTSQAGLLSLCPLSVHLIVILILSFRYCIH